MLTEPFILYASRLTLAATQTIATNPIMLMPIFNILLVIGAVFFLYALFQCTLWPNSTSQRYSYITHPPCYPLFFTDPIPSPSYHSHEERIRTHVHENSPSQRNIHGHPRIPSSPIHTHGRDTAHTHINPTSQGVIHGYRDSGGTSLHR
jgi:hypothetical protein